MKSIYCILMVLFSGNGCDSTTLHNPISKITLYDHGKMLVITLDEKEKQILTQHIINLTANYENNLQLITNEETRTKHIQFGKAIEISFDPKLKVNDYAGVTLETNKIFLFLEGELGAAPTSKNCMFLLSNENGYIGNVFENPDGNASLKNIKALLKIT